MRKNSFFIMLLIFALVLTGCLGGSKKDDDAKSTTLTVYVKDKDNKELITKETTLVLDGVGYSTAKNGKGQFANLNKGEYRLQAATTGYETAEILSVIINQGKNEETIFLKKEENPGVDTLVENVLKAGEGVISILAIQDDLETVLKEDLLPFIDRLSERLLQVLPFDYGDWNLNIDKVAKTITYSSDDADKLELEYQVFINNQDLFDWLSDQLQKPEFNLMALQNELMTAEFTLKESDKIVGNGSLQFYAVIDERLLQEWLKYLDDEAKMPDTLFFEPEGMKIGASFVTKTDDKQEITEASGKIEISGKELLFDGQITSPYIELKGDLSIKFDKELKINSPSEEYYYDLVLGLEKVKFNGEALQRGKIRLSGNLEVDVVLGYEDDYSYEYEEAVPLPKHAELIGEIEDLQSKATLANGTFVFDWKDYAKTKAIFKEGNLNFKFAGEVTPANRFPIYLDVEADYKPEKELEIALAYKYANREIKGNVSFDYYGEVSAKLFDNFGYRISAPYPDPMSTIIATIDKPNAKNDPIGKILVEIHLTEEAIEIRYHKDLGLEDIIIKLPEIDLGKPIAI